MAVKTIDDIIEQIKETIGDTTTDSAIALIEDVTDTLNDLETKATGDGKDWKAEAERIDREWRDRYVNRFTSGSKDDDNFDGEDDEPEKSYTYEDLFK